jgi:integrase
MVMRMLSPWKNPRSDNFWFRRRVPAHLVAFMGRREIKFSLGTSDPQLAKIRCQEENAKLERMWHERAHGPVETVLSHRQIVALAGEFYREMIATHGDEPISAEKWQNVIDRDKQRKEEALKRTPPLFSFPKQIFVRSAFQDEVNEFLKSRGLNLKGAKLDSFVKAYLGAKEQAAGVLKRYAEDDYDEDEKAHRFGDPKVLKDNGKVAAMEMFNLYANEAKLDRKTRVSWGNKIQSLIKSAGHDDLARLTSIQVTDWKNKLLVTKKRQSKKDKLAKKPEENLDAKTIRNSYIAAVKATLNYAKQQNAVLKNVATEVSVRVPKKKKQREKGFTKAEAHLILRATTAPIKADISLEYAMARRWVPWICAYTGARVNEITQLQPTDFLVEDEVNYIRIDAEVAKTGDYRLVPLHDDLIDQGLLEYKASRKGRPLFYDPGRSRGGKESGRHFRKAGEHLARWIREEVGVTDERVAPNHGWRHRFSSMARHVDMHIDIQNIIQGHAGDKVAADYGDAWIEDAYREIMKIPRYDLAN